MGYFVDVYDLFLYSITKKSSILSLLHISKNDINVKLFPHDSLAKANLAEYLQQSTYVIDLQMIGLLVGGILWGILGDKKGRTKTLLASIFIYSVCNFFTSFVENIEWYAWMRFLTGVGLAGELGAGITIITEHLSKEKRGIGTSFLAAMGILGVSFAFYVNYVLNLDLHSIYKYIPNTYQHWLEQKEGWRIAYQIGGFLGFILLLLRIKIFDSSIFIQVKKQANIKRGNFLYLFSNRVVFKKYFFSILVGFPVWYLVGLLINQSDIIGLHFEKPISDIDSAKCVLYYHITVVIGDLASGFICQYFQSRRKTMLVYFIANMVFMGIYFSPLNHSANTMYIICCFLGLTGGFWAIFLTMGAEQFGTNIRATAATSIPNMVRGSLILSNFLFNGFFPVYFDMGVVKSAILTGVVIYFLALWALYFLEETYHKNLDYIEE